MGKRDLISGAFLTALSIYVCMMAYRLGLGTGSTPGAGFAGFGIAFLLGLMSIGMMIKGFIRIGKAREAAAVPPIKWRMPLLILTILSGYGAFFRFLGFPLSTFILMVLLVWVVGRRRFTVALLVSILTVAFSYALFVTALGLPLPLGSVMFLFGE